MWAIITEDPGKLGHGWDPDEFFRTGQSEIDEVVGTALRLVPELKKDEALDFGCGVGRLTRALGAHFKAVTGVDIAPSMIQQAKELNREFAGCEWVLNDCNDLRLFADNRFNLTYTNMVLQHMLPAYSRDYIKEFVRVTAPNGLIVFQVPDKLPSSLGRRIALSILPGVVLSLIPSQLLRMYRRRRYRNASDELLRKIPKHHMEMHGIAKDEILRLMESLEAPVIFIDENNGAGEGWRSWRYFARKNAPT